MSPAVGRGACAMLKRFVAVALTAMLLLCGAGWAWAEDGDFGFDFTGDGYDVAHKLLTSLGVKRAVTPYLLRSQKNKQEVINYGLHSRQVVKK